MINKDKNPVGWAMFMYELEDAVEHLNNMVAEINVNSEYGEEELRINLGHIYSHLNRAWYRRNVAQDVTEKEWEQASKFPIDLEPT